MTWTQGAEDHIARHGVEPHEVHEVLANRFRRLTGRAARTLVFGRTDAGRPLLVVLAPAEGGAASVVTARELTQTERRLHRRKEPGR
ncbi:hypothetical protein [Cellulomonas sp. Marseille-Q8402]